MEAKSKGLKNNYKESNKNTLYSHRTMSFSTSGLKAQMEVYLYRYFELLLVFYKFLVFTSFCTSILMRKVGKQY